jgi:hypothetical protein
VLLRRSRLLKVRVLAPAEIGEGTGTDACRIVACYDAEQQLVSQQFAGFWARTKALINLPSTSSFVGQRVYVLDEAHALSTQAQTALLSAMEDTASSDLFLLYD